MSKHGYINNDELELLILRHRDQPSQQERDRLTELLLLLASKLVYLTREYPEIEPDDVIQEIYMLLVEAHPQFVPGKGKAFNYLTTTSMNCIRHILRKQLVHNTLLSRLYEHKKKAEKL